MVDSKKAEQDSRLILRIDDLHRKLLRAYLRLVWHSMGALSLSCILATRSLEGRLVAAQGRTNNGRGQGAGDPRSRWRKGTCVRHAGAPCHCRGMRERERESDVLSGRGRGGTADQCQREDEDGEGGTARNIVSCQAEEWRQKSVGLGCSASTRPLHPPVMAPNDTRGSMLSNVQKRSNLVRTACNADSSLTAAIALSRERAKDGRENTYSLGTALLHNIEVPRVCT